MKIRPQLTGCFRENVRLKHRSSCNSSIPGLDITEVMSSVGDVMMSLSAVMLSVENHRINIFLPLFKRHKKNVNIRNELNFSDVYRSINDIGSLAKIT